MKEQKQSRPKEVVYRWMRILMTWLTLLFVPPVVFASLVRLSNPHRPLRFDDIMLQEA